MMSFGDVIISGDVILQCFVLCLGTMRGRGHSIILNVNQVKIVKVLTCYLRPKMPAGLLSSLRRSKGGFETMVSD